MSRLLCLKKSLLWASCVMVCFGPTIGWTKRASTSSKRISRTIDWPSIERSIQAQNIRQLHKMARQMRSHQTLGSWLDATELDGVDKKHQSLQSHRQATLPKIEIMRRGIKIIGQRGRKTYTLYPGLRVGDLYVNGNKLSPKSADLEKILISVERILGNTTSQIQWLPRADALAISIAGILLVVGATLVYSGVTGFLFSCAIEVIDKEESVAAKEACGQGLARGSKEVASYIPSLVNDAWANEKTKKPVIPRIKDMRIACKPQGVPSDFFEKGAKRAPGSFEYIPIGDSLGTAVYAYDPGRKEVIVLDEQSKKIRVPIAELDAKLRKTVQKADLPQYVQELVEKLRVRNAEKVFKRFAEACIRERKLPYQKFENSPIAPQGTDTNKPSR